MSTASLAAAPLPLFDPDVMEALARRAATARRIFGLGLQSMGFAAAAWLVLAGPGFLQ